jgi:hypothetical protein
VTLVALNVDANEDEAAVRGHVDRHDLVGHFAVPPQGMLDTLVSEYGAEFVTPPTSPVILVDAAQSSARFLDRGVKPADELAELIE